MVSGKNLPMPSTEGTSDPAQVEPRMSPPIQKRQIGETR
jgi:hypothetical protein